MYGTWKVRGSVCALALASGLCLAPLQGEPQPEWLARFNQERSRLSASPLRPSTLLAIAAQEQAEEMAAAGRGLRSPSAAAISDLLRRVGYRAHDWREAFTYTQDVDTGRHLPLRMAADAGYREVGVGTAYVAGSKLQVFLFATHERDYFASATAGLSDRTRVASEMLARVNALRRRAGVAPLVFDPRLQRSSQRHADDMLERAYFGHRSPEGFGPTERAQAEGYRQGAGENLVEGRLSADEAFQAWLDSAPHRRNLLDPDYREIGLGLGLGETGGNGAKGAGGAGGYRVVWVMSFGRGGSEPNTETRRADSTEHEVVVERVVVLGGR